ncbi:MAG: ATP-binding protein [Actinobacteria bacterium]|jgi:saccharopine dehydrogenase-like NADP-dependent oxidoreductase|nr:ATP-binding protein [Actinomycetota bacterium]
MNILVVGAGGVGASMASIAETRGFFDSFVLADISKESAEAAIAALDDPGKFRAERVDASNVADLVALIERTKSDVIVNACDPRLNPQIFKAAYQARCNYIDMAMNLSTPHPLDPYNKVGRMLGEDQLSDDEKWRERGILALIGMGVEPGLSDVFARYAADHIFDEIHEIGVRDGSNLSIDGYDFAPTFSIWTTIEECLNPPVVWEKKRGFYTTDCFSEPEIFHFPAGIGPVECVNVEHEEVILIPREVKCERVTFKYGLGAEFIDWLKTFAYLGLDSTDKIKVGGVHVAPRDVLAAVLPNPAKLGHLMHGRTCAGTWVKGIADGKPREVYLYHVADNEVTMREYDSQAVLWQTAICPVVALELMADGSWKGTGVKGPEAFDALPFLNILGAHGSHHGMVDMGPGLWPSPRSTGQPGWDRPVRRAVIPAV